MLTDEEYNTRLEKARGFIQLMVKTEREAGFASPEDLSPFDHARTAHAAIQTGIVTEDWDAVTEGFVMLTDVIARLTVLHKADDKAN